MLWTETEMAIAPPPAFEIKHLTRTSTSTAWSKWIRRFRNYIVAAGVTSAKQKRGLLLYLGGNELQDVFETLTPPVHAVRDHSERIDDFEAAVISLTQYFDPTASVGESVTDNFYEPASQNAAPHTRSSENDASPKATICYDIEPASENAEPHRSSENDDSRQATICDDDIEIKQPASRIDAAPVTDNSHTETRIRPSPPSPAILGCESDPLSASKHEKHNETVYDYDDNSKYEDSERQQHGLDDDYQPDAAQKPATVADSKYEDSERQQHDLDDDCQPDAAQKPATVARCNESCSHHENDHERDNLNDDERDKSMPEKDGKKRHGDHDDDEPYESMKDGTHGKQRQSDREENVGQTVATPARRRPDPAPDDHRKRRSFPTPDIMAIRDPDIDPRKRKRKRG